MSKEDLLVDLQRSINEMKEVQDSIIASQKEISQLFQKSAQESLKKKDIWDVLSAIAPILSGTIIAIGGAFFTLTYNQQQLKLQEIQTIEKFIPHLLGDEKSKRAAVLAISSLTDEKLAAKVAAIFASEGTVSALESIAKAGKKSDKKIIDNELAAALDSVAANYSSEKRYEEAINAYRKALKIKETNYGAESPLLLENLDKLAELYQADNDFTEAEYILKRKAQIQKVIYGPRSFQVAHVLKKLTELCEIQGQKEKAQLYKSELKQIEQSLASSVQSTEKNADDFFVGSSATADSTNDIELKESNKDSVGMKEDSAQSKPTETKAQIGISNDISKQTVDNSKKSDIQPNETNSSEQVPASVGSSVQDN